jgi:quercetin dioxygenase-like cupin family protein
VEKILIGMKKEENMYTITRYKINLKILAVIGIAILIVLAISLYWMAGAAEATGPSGVVGELLGAGTLEKNIRGHFSLVPANTGFNVKSDIGQVITMKFTVEPGGVFGWHQHSGPVWAIVTQGNLTYYFSDPDCSSVEYPAGSVFMDQGDYTHNARNEGSVPVEIIVTFMLPDGGAPSIPQTDPGYCDF